MRRWARWVLLAVCLGCLAKNVFGRENAWSLSAFFVSGGLWYFLAWKRARELDAPQPYRRR